MSFTVRDYQIRVNSLGLPMAPLTVDNENGPNTRNGIKEAKKALHVLHKEDIFHPSGITRVHWHWTASTHLVTPEVASHYNNVFDINGKEYLGGAPAKDQARYSYKGDNPIGVSHTYHGNTGAIGMGVVACAGREVLDWGKGIVNIGKYPMSWPQIDAMLERTARYCIEFDIRPSEWTTITHAEVQDNIGIKQRGKWDIRVLPDAPTKLLGVKEAGDILRARMIEKFM